jgi:predicted transcriptional regulator
MKQEMLAVRIDAELKEKLRKLAEGEDRTLSNYVIKVLREHAEAADKKPKR